MAQNSKVHALYIVLILLLLGGLVFTNLKLKKSTETIRVTTTELTDVNNLKAELEVEYQKAMADLETAKSEKLDIEGLLSERESELEAKKKQIADLLKSGQTNQADLNKARELIKQLNAERLAFQAKIDSLTVLNEELNQVNVNLTSERDELTETVANVTAEKESLNQENTNLKSKVNKAEILTITNIKVTPIKYKSNGKEVEVKKSKTVESLKICFDMLVNRIAPAGKTEMNVRVIGPDGVTIQMGALGSGELTDATTGNSIPYTYTIQPDYQNEEKTVCSIWKQDNDFAPGRYSAEVYQKGLLIGQENFELK
ncbi:MAG: hypothetical protein M9887_03865 [Chitinophagales bacterium]|nr:hypothetical protein [Chitinophagales bacterium]